MRNINSRKHSELIYLIREMKTLFSLEELCDAHDALATHSENLNNLHQEYLQTINHLEKIIEEYHAESKVIRHLLMSKPFRKLKLKKSQPDKYKVIVKMVNNFAS